MRETHNQWIILKILFRHRSFSELLRDPLHVEFFKRFLAAKHKDTPLLFWIAVDEIKKSSTGKPKQTRVSAIIKRFFGGPDKGMIFFIFKMYEYYALSYR